MNRRIWALFFVAAVMAVDSFADCKFDLYSTRYSSKNKGDLEVAKRNPSELQGVKMYPALEKAYQVNYYEGQDSQQCNSQSRVEVEVAGGGFLVMQGIIPLKRSPVKDKEFPFALIPEDDFGEETVLAFDKKSTCFFGMLRDNASGKIKAEKTGSCENFLNEKISY
jgi:hypothetical protein